MLGQPIQWSHVGILAKAYFRYAIRGGSGLIFLVAFLFIGLMAAGFMIDPLKQQLKQAEKTVKQDIDDKQFVDQVVILARPVVSWFVGADESKEKDPFVEHLVVERPPILSAYLLILFGIVPFVSCLGAFNQLSGDIGTKGLRYLLLRTERINVIVARFIATVLFSAIVTLFIILVVVTYISLNFDSSTFGELLVWGLKGWLAAVILSLPYICMCTWLSSAFDTPIATLFLCLLATAFPILGLKIGGTVAENAMIGQDVDLDWLDRLTPWGWKYELLHPSFGPFLLSAAIMVGVAAAFWFLAVRHFLRRDL